jgi:hypothetical protein
MEEEVMSNADRERWYLRDILNGRAACFHVRVLVRDVQRAAEMQARGRDRSAARIIRQAAVAIPETDCPAIGWNPSGIDPFDWMEERRMEREFGTGHLGSALACV